MRLLYFFTGKQTNIIVCQFYLQNIFRDVKKNLYLKISRKNDHLLSFKKIKHVGKSATSQLEIQVSELTPAINNVNLKGFF